ncbi:MAG TPA: cellulose synthase catalytic subunit [Streptosporangiaceae bacterium]|nr:cellulose synthase catalytic subunit [Streptosporangiaceae bacterium]
MTALRDRAVAGSRRAGPTAAEPAGRGPPGADRYLPRPPTRTEKYSYLGARRPYVFAWLLIAAMGILYGYVRVATKAWWTMPALLLLVVMVPPVVINFWLRIGRPRLTLARHRAIISSYTYGHEAIDVFLPSCGEPVELLDNTMRCASAVRWLGPKTVYVLDDSAREEVRALAARYGFRYVVRANRGEMRKAGNLINAFGISDGEFIMVLDADFAVRPDFLYETMPYTADPKVGVVQTAQFFDTRNRSFPYIQRYAGTLQDIFFRFIQPARDRYRAAICAGTNLVYRRSAVEAAGGFATVPIGEDVHSGVKLGWAGYEVRYVPLCLAKGVAPADFASLANQQNRWCRSSMMLMVDKHFREARYSWQQRVAYWAAFLYYMSSAALLFTGPFPTLTMMWFFPRLVFPYNYLVILPSFAATLFAFPLLSRGWRPTIYRVCVINSCCHLYALWYSVRGRIAEWVPTGASRGQDPVPLAVGRILRTWIVTVQGLLWASLVLRIDEFGWRPYWATLVLTAYQLFMLAPLMTCMRERHPAASPAAAAAPPAREAA